MATAGKGVLQTVNLVAAAANATLVVYDNAAAASGTVLARVSAPANWSISLPIGNLPYVNGLWCVLTGAGATAAVYFE